MKFNNSENGQSSSMIIIIAVVVIILGGVAFFLTQSKSKNAENANIEPTNQESTQTEALPTETSVNPSEAMGENMEPTSTDATGKTVTVEISGSNFKFTPATITANQRDTVKVVFKNSNGFHDFVIDEFNVKTKQITAGSSETISFVADKKGTFEFYCSVGNHRQQGMVGTLTVK